MNSSPHIQPPRWMDRFLGWFCNDSELEILRGDLYELYQKRADERGKILADLFFFLEVLDLFRPFALKNPLDTKITLMFKNYLTITWRNFSRQKLYSTLNISGLVIGLGCFLLIFFYIRDELSYDRFHPDADRIYRLIEHFESDGIGEHSASLPFPTGPALVNSFPGQVERAVRLFNFQSPTLALANKAADKAFNESQLFFADSTFLEVFDFALLQGNRATALENPNSILITASMAEKYFGEEDPMGKLLEFQGTQDLQVTGILEDAPLNAHFQYDFIVSFSSLRQWFNGSYPSTWYWNPCWTYVRLAPPNDPQRVAAQFPAFVEQHFPDFIRDDVELELQPLQDIHLLSQLDYEIQANSSMANIYIFGGIAFFVLFIAAINFINLSTARATKRAKEVGIRKTLGSQKSQLITQFIFESVLFSTLAVGIALLLVGVILPAFNGFVEKSITWSDLLQPDFLVGALSLALVVGLLSGFYPAFILSSFETVTVLKNGPLKARGLTFRKVLVTTQFAISIFLIAGTFVALDQFKLLRDQDEGFDEEDILMIPVIRSPIGAHYEYFREQALQSAHIHTVTAVEEIIGAKHQVGNYRFAGMEKSRPFPRFFVRHDFTETMDIELVAGRDYDRAFSTDDSLAIVVNESLVQAMGWSSPDDAIGEQYYFRNELRGKVVGVVKDYNFVSKHHPIGPLVLDLNTNPGAFNLFIKYLAVKVDHQNVQEAIADLEKTWKATLPGRPFDCFFLEDRLNDSYKSEQKLSQITVLFSILAIAVACLGLFGLATFSVERRTKEIGLRKVLGIKTSQIVVMLSKEFFYLIVVAFVVSIPVSYLLLNRWLSGFAYRVQLEAWPFVLAGIIAIAVSMLTVLFHALKAAMINPVQTLKHE